MPTPQSRPVVRAAPRTVPLHVTTLQGQAQPAGFVSRMVAFIIDVILVLISAAIIGGIGYLVLNFFGLGIRVLQIFVPGTLLDRIRQIDVVATAVVIAVYIPAYFIVSWVLVGATPGKQILGLKVVHGDHPHIAWLRAIVRFIAYFISALAFFLGFIWVLFDGKRQGWHDKIAKTYVIYAWEVPPHE